MVYRGAAIGPLGDVDLMGFSVLAEMTYYVKHDRPQSSMILVKQMRGYEAE